MSKDEKVKKIFRKIYQKNKKIDILINSAGATGGGKIETIKYYRQVEPKSYSVVYGTDLINDYINDIETLLKKD